jgi:hypothetical protein
MSKNKSKYKGGTPPKSENAYIKEAARKLPIKEAYIDSSMFTSGLGFAIIARQKKNGEMVVGAFVVDIFCLGIKDAFTKVMAEEDFREYITSVSEMENVKLEQRDPNFVQNVIYAAYEYADELDFAPCKEWALAQYVLDDVDAIEYEEIECGKDGKPFYIEGPNDKTIQILNKLEDKLGIHGFYVMLNKDEDEYDDDEYDDDEYDDDEYDDDEDRDDGDFDTYEEIEEEKK